MSKRYIICFFVLLVSSVFCVGHLIAQSGGDKNIKILLLMAQGYGLNTNFNHDDMEEYGWDITTIGISKVIQPCPGYSGRLPMTVDKLVSEITDITQYDVLAIMPASWKHDPDVYRDLLNNQQALNLVKEAVDSGLIVWATCAGVRILAAANVINGKSVVGAYNYRNEYTAAGATYLGDDHPPVIDGNIITCVRDQYYHVKNSEAIMIALQKKYNMILNKGAIK